MGTIVIATFYNIHLIEFLLGKWVISQRLLKEFGLKYLINANKETDNLNEFEFIQSSKTIFCEGCDKVCLLFCGLPVFDKCKSFAESILNKTYYDDTKYPDVKRFLQNEGIVTGNMIKNLIAVTGVKIDETLQFHILFDKFYATIIKKTNGKNVIVDISYLERHLEGGDFFVQ